MSWMNPLLALSLYLHAVLDGSVAEPLRTYRDTDPLTGKSLECDRCPPGKYLRTSCTETRKSVCADCPDGSFTELWNYIEKCIRCGVCGHNQVIKTACTAHSDCQCECKQGYYYKAQYDMCLRHSECQAGQEVLIAGTPDADTLCATCPNGTFSNIVSAKKNCSEHKDCRAAGLMLLLRGSTWHDSICMSCEEPKAVGDYLRKIIPSFFTHQKMMVRRLRQILRKMLSEDGKKHEGISNLNLPEVQQKINDWVASATAAQIRQVPAILTRAGASNAGERLQNKLHRIESHLSKLCESDMVTPAF